MKIMATVEWKQIQEAPQLMTDLLEYTEMMNVRSSSIKRKVEDMDVACLRNHPQDCRQELDGSRGMFVKRLKPILEPVEDPVKGRLILIEHHCIWPDFTICNDKHGINFKLANNRTKVSYNKITFRYSI
jgi:hypothetical protein